MINDFSSCLRSLDKNKLIRIYLINNVCILTEPKHLQFFDNYLTYDGKSGTIYFTDPKKIYPDDCDLLQRTIGDINIVPYSAISLITDAQDAG